MIKRRGRKIVVTATHPGERKTCEVTIQCKNKCKEGKVEAPGHASGPDNDVSN
jgi:hypothetical protein